MPCQIREMGGKTAGSSCSTNLEKQRRNPGGEFVLYHFGQTGAQIIKWNILKNKKYFFLKTDPLYDLGHSLAKW